MLTRCRTIIAFICIRTHQNKRSKIRKCAYLFSSCETHFRPIRSVTCHMGSHGVTGHSLQARQTRPASTRAKQARTRFTYPRGIKAWVGVGGYLLVYTQIVYSKTFVEYLTYLSLPIYRQSPIRVVTKLSVRPTTLIGRNLLSTWSRQNTISCKRLTQVIVLQQVKFETNKFTVTEQN